ncbi:MAG: glycine cleavage system aminomethyltransferase GcvT [Rubrimonas sp.]|uniref:glycine cleavage system aminomethyltransferase GcvT n=1 Tax=Rubrimonas sp. TaxID=2036015 RepID=UPI002FDE67C0
MTATAPRRTPLHDLHTRLGGRMVDFAGWSLPVQYPAGILAEHAQCRERAALFDVSHMGQVALRSPDDPEAAARALERVAPGALATLGPGKARYTQFTTDEGGVIDDLIVSHAGDHLFVVVNAARAAVDIAHLRARLPDLDIAPLDRALIALQGPAAETALAPLVPQAAALAFMETTEAPWRGAALRVSRLGYTGEDGFEISTPPELAEAFAEALLAQPGVAPAGLGARDTLRLEAGLPLWGQDIDEGVTPAEAGLGWSIPRRRREAADFPGAQIILRQLSDGSRRRLVAIRPEGRAPARAGVEIRVEGRAVGRITSGGFGPTIGAPVALGLVEAGAAAPGTALELIVRGAALPARVVESPFVPHRYKRAAAGAQQGSAA